MRVQYSRAGFDLTGTDAEREADTAILWSGKDPVLALTRVAGRWEVYEIVTFGRTYETVADVLNDLDFEGGWE